jgi:hypothetical protein
VLGLWLSGRTLALLMCEALGLIPQYYKKKKKTKTPIPPSQNYDWNNNNNNNNHL